ncbi:hypothetical protein IFT98_16125 [Pseudomonas sp. CFBP 8770]|uniref:hypothetical protein n=1 Tax=unclassified Pseudomonas TaxID=196821 RepID=UPI00177B6C77|nr:MULTISPECIES: hypothetical protein [unclassified Pseudomonas]MBD8476094.1 hypothetical protein [Pseudomonas sp. CFBP 8773]MBD8648523.1 hypothetical protein [Pseudomonas sp. CFBP 8770]
MTMPSAPKIFRMAEALILCLPVSDPFAPQRQQVSGWYGSKNTPTNSLQRLSKAGDAAMLSLGRFTANGFEHPSLVDDLNTTETATLKEAVPVILANHFMLPSDPLPQTIRDIERQLCVAGFIDPSFRL